jgi:hypothetical protein
MWVWIDGERWAADGQPALYEQHDTFVSGVDREVYGLVVNQVESLVLSVALYNFRHPEQPDLFQEETAAGNRLSEQMEAHGPFG